MKERQEQAAARPSEKTTCERGAREIYGYDDEDVNYWADDADEAALTFSTEKATLWRGRCLR